MRRVTRHTTWEILAPALTALVVATFLLLTTQILRVGEAAFGYGLRASDFISILGLLLPRFLVFALPLAVLVGVLGGLGRMASDREMLAWSASGLSPARLLPAPLLVGLVASALCLGLTTWGEPRSLGGLSQRLATVIERNLATGLEPGVIHQDIPGVLLHARRRLDEGVLGEVFMHLELEAGQATLAAKRARLEPTGGRGLRLALEDGEMVRPDAGGLRPSDEPDPHGAPRIAVEQESPELGVSATTPEAAAPAAPTLDRIRFETASVGLDIADTVGRRARFIGGRDAMTMGELREEMREGRWPAQRRRAAVTFHRRIVVPFSCLALAVLATGMALMSAAPGSTRRGAGFVAGIGAMLGYYLLLRVAENLSVSGTAPAAILMWIPNVLAVAVGVVFLTRAVRP